MSVMDAVVRGNMECPGCAFFGLSHWPGCGNQNVFAPRMRVTTRRSYPQLSAPGEFPRVFGERLEVRIEAVEDEPFPPCGGAGG